MAFSETIASGIVRLLDWFYDHFVPSLFSKEVVRYFICGVGNYIVLDSLLYYLIYHYLVAERYIYLSVVDFTISPHVAALILVFPLTFLTGFWLNRHVAFKATEEHSPRQMVRYAVTIVGSILLSYLTLKLLVEGAGLWATPAKVVASVVTSIYSYLAARLFTFRTYHKKI